MFGRLIGKIISTPVRLVNVAVKVADEVCDPVPRKLSERDPLKLDEVADAIGKACEE